MGERTTIRAWSYLFFALMVLIASWESHLAGTALAAPGIPQEAIRIRILANSDSARDQWIKKRVRDEIVTAFGIWNETYADIGEARRALRRRLPELERIVGGLLTEYGFDYGYKVDLGPAEFPAKVFAGETYPAGRYETLLITLGEGRGENWWCVLFPPLCFGYGAIGTKEDAPGQSAAARDGGEIAGEALTGEIDGHAETSETHDDGHSHERGEGVEVRFFLLDSLKKAGSFLKHWLA